MYNDLKFIKNKIRDIEFKMFRENQNCWIKIIPTKKNSIKSTIYIMINNEEYSWEIYDKFGNDVNKIYLKGYKIEPCFYLEIGDIRYSIHFFYDKIDIKKIIKNHDKKMYINKNCNCKSIDVECWAIAIYFTSRKEKEPFCFM